MDDFGIAEIAGIIGLVLSLIGIILGIIGMF